MKDIPVKNEDGVLIGTAHMQDDGKHGYVGIIVLGSGLEAMSVARALAEEHAPKIGVSVMSLEGAIEGAMQFVSPKNEVDDFLEHLMMETDRRRSMIEELKCVELETYTDYENREQAKQGWYNPPRIGESAAAKRKTALPCVRNRTHSQYKFSWKKKKPKKYRA